MIRLAEHLLAAALMAGGLSQPAAAAAQQIDWIELLPVEDRATFDPAPPPPPNQMVYVIMKQGIKLDSMYSAYWISGTLSARSRSTRLGAAVYTLTATAAEEYRF